MKKIILVAAILLSKISTGQIFKGGKVTVAILTEQSSPIENASVELLNSKDSVLVKTAISDRNGIAEIDNIKEGSFLLKTTMMGFSTGYSEVFSITSEKPSVTISSLTMKQDTGKHLQNVTVIAKKPFIQRLSDRFVVNVESSITSAGSSAIEVLEQSPGVNIDQNNMISLRGRSGVIIMIDGKVTPLTGADLANYLRALPANAIDRIEIITNPSARYEAAGNSGIIDIRMKKDQRLGTNGTFSAGMGHGVYPRANSGVTFNYRNKKTNVFGNYNNSYRKDLNKITMNRNFFKAGALIGSDQKDSYSTTPNNSHNIRLGADFFASKKTIVGFVASSNFSERHFTLNNKSLNFNSAHQPFYSFTTFSTENSSSNNAVFNVNLKHTFNKSNELTVDVDHGVYNSGSLSRVATNFLEVNGSQRRPNDILDGDQDGKLRLYAAKADYIQQLKNAAKFEAGIRTSYVSSDNDAKFFNVTPSGSEVDYTKTNHFVYEEYNKAAYVNYSKEFKKFNLQLGLRGEQTDIKTHQQVGNVKWDSAYLQMFPSAFFNYKVTKNQTLGVSVSRRIGRPGYSQLNPFLFLMDATTYSTGNPQLLPQFTWSYEMSYTVKNFFFNFGYSQTKDPQILAIARILDVLPNYPIDPSADSNITIERTVNLRESNSYVLTISAPVNIRKWWNMTNNMNVLYDHFKGNIGGAQLSSGTPSAYIRSNNTFSLNKGWAAELNGNYFSGRRSGYVIFSSQWSLAAGAQKTIIQGKGTLRFNVTDIFWTSVLRYANTYQGAYTDKGQARRETRVANLSFTYRFGNNKVQAARVRTTASEEERRRSGG